MPLKLFTNLGSRIYQVISAVNPSHFSCLINCIQLVLGSVKSCMNFHASYITISQDIFLTSKPLLSNLLRVYLLKSRFCIIVKTLVETILTHINDQKQLHFILLLILRIVVYCTLLDRPKRLERDKGWLGGRWMNL